MSDDVHIIIQPGEYLFRIVVDRAVCATSCATGVGSCKKGAAVLRIYGQGREVHVDAGSL